MRAKLNPFFGDSGSVRRMQGDVCIGWDCGSIQQYQRTRELVIFYEERRNNRQL